jgi:hypothetical protein
VAIDLGDTEQLVAWVRRDESGRLRVHELLLLDSGEPVSVDRLRALRPSAIEGLLNLPSEHAAIQEQLDEPPAIDLAAPLHHFEAVKAPAPRVYEKSGVSLMRRAATGALPATRPSRGYADTFYEQVGDVYRAALRHGRAPVIAVADKWNVPRSTAARWVKEARKRKTLGPAPAPGQKGEMANAC